MATLVLGAIGAGIGSIYGPGGMYKGFMIGSAIGSYIDESNLSQHAEVGKLSDLKYSGSSYGSVIPRVWGKQKVSGNVIWVATDATGNHLVQHSKSSSQGGGSGGGGASSTTYWYTATFAVLICAGTLTMPDGSSVNRNAKLKRIWADDVLVYDDTKTGLAMTLGTNLFFYSGTETQSASPIISAKMGAANTPAYRGSTYIVVQDLNLANFSNRIPNLSFEVWTDDDGAGTGHMTVGTIISDVARQTGLVASDIDLSQATAVVTGLLEGARNSGDQTIAPLLLAYAYDLVEVDGVLRIVARGGTPVLTIDATHLGSKMGGVHDENAKYTRTRSMQTELPGRLDLQYSDVGTSYEQGVQSDIRQSANVQNITTVTVNLALDSTTARRIACYQMDDLWTGVEKYAFNLPWMYLALCPADVVILPTAAGSVRLRIIDVGLAPVGELRFQAILDGSNVMSQTTTGTTGSGGGATSLTPVPSNFLVWSGTEIQDADQNYPGFYVAACGSGTNAALWVGGVVYYSLDSGTSWTQGPSITCASVFGITTGVLSATGAVANTYDNTNTVGVNVSSTNGTLIGLSDANISAGNNHAYCGGEILAFGTATLGGSAGLYTLSHLRRGERGSVMSGHASGEKFVVVTPNAVRVSVPSSAVGTTVQVKVVSNMQTLSDVTAQNVVITGRTLTHTETVIASVVTPHFIAPVTIASGVPADAAIAWTTLDLTAYCPATTQAVMLQVAHRLTGIGEQLTLQTRAASAGQVYTLQDISAISNDADEANATTEVIRPIDANTTYRHIDFTRAGTGGTWSVKLIGYWG